MHRRFIMQILPANVLNNYNISDCINQNPNFEHSHNTMKESAYKPSQKAFITGMSILGVAGSLALLAKGAGYSLKPSKMFKNIKNSYLAKADFEAKEVIAMGAGSCLGGLAAGCIVDKNKANRKAKLRESLMQIGNVSIPILTVHLMSKKIFGKSSKSIQAFAGLGGVGIGVVLANFIMNRLNNLIFNEPIGNGRKIKLTDFSAHLDDFVLAAHYIAPKSKLVHAIGRIVPAALVIPGMEVGHKTAVPQND